MGRAEMGFCVCNMTVAFFVDLGIVAVVVRRC